MDEKWIIEEHKERENSRISIITRSKKVGQIMRYVAHMQLAVDSDYEQALIDARLIAAAPELLEALEKIADMNYRLAAVNGCACDANKVARAAIAKAKGE